jgi:hypothetical protein
LPKKSSFNFGKDESFKVKNLPNCYHDIFKEKYSFLRQFVKSLQTPCLFVHFQDWLQPFYPKYFFQLIIYLLQMLAQKQSNQSSEDCMENSEHLHFEEKFKKNA